MIFGEILEKIFFPFAILTKMVLLKPESTKNLLMSYTLGRSTLFYVVNWCQFPYQWSAEFLHGTTLNGFPMAI